jgi:hypothetical protein
VIRHQARNVCEALQVGLRAIMRHGEPADSRDGPVLTMSGPVTTLYERPTERVLFSARRDANPFFHLFESFWMLAGSRDGRWLDRYVSGFSTRFGNAKGQIEDGYGWRWRHHFGDDQLPALVQLLVDQPNTRQAVLQMWDPACDLLGPPAARPCNTAVYFRIRSRKGERWLDMTVTCRSNDLVMGAHGANAVHMSVLQELVACATETRVGRYWQISNDYHAYTRDLEKLGTAGDWANHADADDRYSLGHVSPSPLFEREHLSVLQSETWLWMAEPARHPPEQMVCRVFGELLMPMARAHKQAKMRDYPAALCSLEEIVGHDDWRTAAREWVERRQARYLARPQTE